MTATLANCGSGYSGTDHYTYDYGQSANPQLNRSQLTQATSTSYTGTENYLYDQTAPGQPGSSTGPGNATYFFEGADHSYNADNQLVGETYDGNGNPTTYSRQAATFDPENRMTSYGTVQTDGYSADGLRAWKQTSAGKTYFLYDGSQPVGEYDSTGTLSATNVFGANGLISRRTAGASVFYNFDDRGNAIQSLYANGNSYYVFEYDVWGNRTEPVTDTPGPWDMGAQFGYYTDTETGLSLLTHRFYDPVVGRFLTRDPIGYDGGINLYGYVGNDPVNEDDPLGLSGLLPPGGTGGPRNPPGYNSGWPNGTDQRGDYVQDPDNGDKYHPHDQDDTHWGHYDRTDRNGKRKGRFPKRCLKPRPNQEKIRAKDKDHGFTDPWEDDTVYPIHHDGPFDWLNNVADSWARGWHNILGGGGFPIGGASGAGESAW